MSQAGAFPFIVRLNRVDCLTLSSVVTTALATAMTLDQHFNLAMALLFVAMGCDGLDGMLARKWGLARNFGRYLDGFMDVLIYLVSPALLAYQSGFNGAWGLFILAGYQLLLLQWPLLLCNSLLALALLVFSVLMVSRQPFFKFTSLLQILALTGGGALLFLLLDLRQRGIDFTRWPWATVFWLQLPVVIGGVLHMVVVTRDWLPALKIPLQHHWFGANKTLRGFLVMPLLSALGGWCMAPSGEWVLTGALAGLAYVLAELPNSFIKRRMGVPPGEVPRRFRLLFVAVDQLDSGLGIALLYALLGYGWGGGG